MYQEIINLIINTLILNGYNIQEIGTVNAVKKRNNGKLFSLEDHIAGMVFALLSNQRPWKAIEDNYDKICKIFHDFNPLYLLNADPVLLVNQIREIKCGNRSISSQMNSLSYNINQFIRIINLYGSMDNYVTSDEAYNIAKSFAYGDYKLKQMGIALAIEYLKNVGIDTFKPDLHIKRLFGKERLCFSNKNLASEKEILDIIKKISFETKIPMIEIDSILWQFCATNYAEICSANPNCNICLVKKKCNHGKLL